ncbi:MAG: helix-turn-helix transcriptional regulator [Bdellovibrionales bacterium]|nr:helix-turn-helix transcriptional regulator [Bdellovibrionales bacterium]
MFNEFLREQREAAGLSQKEVATKLGYSSAQFISNWERGISAPPVKILRKLAKLYNVKDATLLDTYLTFVVQSIEDEFYSQRKA